VTKGVPTKVIASCCGLSGFAVAVIAGLAVANPADLVLFRAIVALIACFVVGSLVGTAVEKTVEAAGADYIKSRPVVDLPKSSTPAKPVDQDEGVLLV
jgi:tetrahydromethanopterin S-methyltransferase subunit C